MQQAQIALYAFKTGVAVSANLDIGGFDTHNNNDDQQTSQQMQILVALDYLYSQLEVMGIADKTYVLVGLRLRPDSLLQRRRRQGPLEHHQHAPLRPEDPRQRGHRRDRRGLQAEDGEHQDAGHRRHRHPDRAPPHPRWSCAGSPASPGRIWTPSSRSPERRSDSLAELRACSPGVASDPRLGRPREACFSTLTEADRRLGARSSLVNRRQPGLREAQRGNPLRLFHVAILRSRGGSSGAGQSGRRARPGGRSGIPGRSRSRGRGARPTIRRLDAFGGGAEAHGAAEADDGAAELGVAALADDAVDERLVDLDDVHVEAAQVRERRVAGAEVVDGKLHAVGLERDEDRLALFEGDALGDLEDRATRGSRPKSTSARSTSSMMPASLELARRDVDVIFRGPRCAAWTARLSHASRRTQRPSATIAPVSSASGMKSTGGISPRSG